MIRDFELRDIPVLHRYRNRGLFLDSVRTLTWGTGLVPVGALLSYLAPATGVFTSICKAKDDPGNPLVGQVVHTLGSPYARFSFLAPETAIDSSALPELLEAMVKRVAVRGAHNLVAEVDESSQAFEALRQSGFSVYARQRVWKINNIGATNGTRTPWRAINPHDEFAIRKLYNELVPGLVQQVEPVPWEHMGGQAYYKDDDLLAFVEMSHGPGGIWVQPFIHPQIEEVTARLNDLLQNLQPLFARPVYIVVRSYQAWLEYALENLEAEVGPNQAVMVKRMAITQSAVRNMSLPALESGAAKTTAPIVTPPAVHGSNGSTLITYDKKADNRRS
jgi:hypothetical protein